jgi:hypothetical protein
MAELIKHYMSKLFSIFGLIKFLRTLQEKAFLKVSIEFVDGGASIDANFNRFFIHELDKQYTGNPVYDPLLPDNEKVALYLYDIISGIAVPLLPKEEDEDQSDDYNSIPELSQGGVKTTVDLADHSDNRAAVKGMKIEKG